MIWQLLLNESKSRYLEFPEDISVHVLFLIQYICQAGFFVKGNDRFTEGDTRSGTVCCLHLM